MSKITLEQWRVLQTVVDSGGFTQAAEVLHKSQSSVSYSVTKLQQQLGFSILVMEGRKAKLTERGYLLLEHSRALIKQSDQLEYLAKTLEMGWGKELYLNIDSSMPYSLVLEALTAFKKKSPGTRVLVTEGLPSKLTLNAKSEHTTFLTLTSTQPSPDHVPILKLALFAVVSNRHSLANQALPIKMDSLSREHQIKLNSCTIHKSEDNSASIVTNIPALIEMVIRGFGYAWLPLFEIKSLLDKSELVCLEVIDLKAPAQSIYALCSADLDTVGCADLFIETIKEIAN